jgi:hypothetical protein
MKAEDSGKLQIRWCWLDGSWWLEQAQYLRAEPVLTSYDFFCSFLCTHALQHWSNTIIRLKWINLNTTTALTGFVHWMDSSECNWRSMGQGRPFYSEHVRVGVGGNVQARPCCRVRCLLGWGLHRQRKAVMDHCVLWHRWGFFQSSMSWDEVSKTMICSSIADVLELLWCKIVQKLSAGVCRTCSTSQSMWGHGADVNSQDIINWDEICVDHDQLFHCGCFGVDLV